MIKAEYTVTGVLAYQDPITKEDRFSIILNDQGRGDLLRDLLKPPGPPPAPVCITIDRPEVAARFKPGMRILGIFGPAELLEPGLQEAMDAFAETGT